MKFLLSWIKEFFIFKKKIKIKKICKILNNIGIEILSIKKIYPINFKYKKNIILGKIIFIIKKKKFFLFKIVIKNKYKNFFFIKNKKYIKKNTKILIEKINNKYYIVCKEYNYDYVIKTFIPYNLSYLSYYFNLINEIYSYLKYKKKKNLKIKKFNNKLYIKKKNIKFNI
ncbi:MAG: hypothetical protein NHF93_01020, partial [Candidatus Shikimatogenerans bostrichidophilus]